MNCLRLQPEGEIAAIGGFSRKLKEAACVKRALAEALLNYAFLFFRLKPFLWDACLRLKPEAIHKAAEVESKQK